LKIRIVAWEAKGWKRGDFMFREAMRGRGLERKGKKNIEPYIN